MSDFAERFEGLRIWQQVRVVANEVYDALVNCCDYGFCDPIQRATVPSMNNIAEGFERRTAKDFGHFLDIAKASSGEVRSMLYLAEDRKYLSAENVAAMAGQSLRALSWDCRI